MPARPSDTSNQDNENVEMAELMQMYHQAQGGMPAWMKNMNFVDADGEEDYSESHMLQGDPYGDEDGDDMDRIQANHRG